MEGLFFRGRGGGGGPEQKGKDQISCTFLPQKWERKVKLILMLNLNFIFVSTQKIQSKYLCIDKKSKNILQLVLLRKR